MSRITRLAPAARGLADDVTSVLAASGFHRHNPEYGDEGFHVMVEGRPHGRRRVVHVTHVAPSLYDLPNDRPDLPGEQARRDRRRARAAAYAVCLAAAGYTVASMDGYVVVYPKQV